MPINNETRILKTNTIEEFRQKTNDVSLHLGDNGLIDSRILDKTQSFTASANQTLFTSNTLRFELKPGETLDDTANSESLSVGLVKVFKDGTELSQGLDAANFEVPNFTLLVTLANSPTIPSEFVEGAVLTQSGGFSGTLLSASSTELRFKAFTGSFSTSQNLGIPHTDANKRVNSADISNQTAQDASFGNIIRLNTAASAGEVIKIVSTSLVDAVNEVQDDVGDITAIDSGIPLRSDIVVAVNSFKGEVGNAADLTPAASTVVGAINEHETDIGTVGNLTTSATNLTNAINEHDAELGTISAAAFGTSASTVSTAIAELHTDVDARLKLTSGSEQTLNTDATFSNGNTLVFPSGSTLDIRNGLLQTGAGGLSVTTAFIDFNANLDERGLSFERSDFGNGVDVKLYWDEAYAASQPDRGFRVDGLNTGSSAETADLVTFYNAQDLFANNTETGVVVNWDSTNQNFDINLDADPTIQLSGDIGGSVTLTDLQTTTYTLATTIQAGSVENSMLAGSIAASKLAGSIGNSKLTNSSITVSDGSNTSPIALGGTLTFAGTSNEIEVAESAGTVTIGLPSNVTVGNNLTVANDVTITGDLTVNGTQTTLNTATLEVEDTLILTGTSSTEPTTGGFGIETQQFSGVGTHSNAASNVTGSHSFVYNFATDRWEADGSLVLSEATVGVPGVKVSSASNPLSETDLGQSNALDFNEGSGITILGATSGNDIDVTITNSDRGSSQNIFKNVAVAGQSTIVAESNDDTLTIVGGTGITALTNAGTDTLTIEDSNSGVTAGNYGSQFVVPSITVNEKGRITSASNNTAISLSALGFTGSTSADNYGSFNVQIDSNSAEAVGSGDTLKFIGGTAVTLAKSQGTNQEIVTINSSDTVTNVGISGSETTGTITLAGGSNTSISQTGNTVTFSSTDTNTVTNLGANNSNYTSGNINVVGSGATSVSKSGNTITITSTDTNTDTNTVTSVGVSGNLSTGNITLQGSGGTSVSKSGGTITISSGSIPTNNNQLTNGAGYTTYSSNQATSTTSAVTFASVSASGDIIAFATSDERLKDNKLVIENSLDKVGKLKGYEFDWNDKQDIFEGHDVGVIAQEVEKVLPEVVQTRENGYKAVKYEKLVPLLINAINELKAEIEELKDINSKV